MEYARHGGACCGYAHVYGFDNATPADLDRMISYHREQGGGGTNRILEAILSERQLNPPARGGSITRETRDAGGWVAVLAQRGFRLAAEWTNSNTGRNCYQFLLIENLHTDNADHRRTFEWPARIERAAPVEVVLQGRFVPAVGDTLRRLVRGNHFEDILTITRVNNGSFSGTWQSDGGISGNFYVNQISPETWRKVEFRQGNDGSQPAPVDPNLPVHIWYDGRSVPARVIEPTGGQNISARALEPLIGGQGIDLTHVWSYQRTTGDWATPIGGDFRGRLYNSEGNLAVEVVNAAPVQAPPPVPDRPAVQTVLTEYYAVYADGRIGRVPYDSIADLRADQPRVRRYRTRVFQSDGTFSTGEPTAF